MLWRWRRRGGTLRPYKRGLRGNVSVCLNWPRCLAARPTLGGGEVLHSELHKLKGRFCFVHVFDQSRRLDVVEWLALVHRGLSLTTPPEAEKRLIEPSLESPSRGCGPSQ